MRIGIPKEIKNNEYRVGLTPTSVRELTEYGHDVFVEGAATAEAVDTLARKEGLDMPITAAVAGLLANRLDVRDAMHLLLTRPLKEE